MRKSRFSEEQIIAILREQEAGRPMAEVCRKHGISQYTVPTTPIDRGTSVCTLGLMAALCGRLPNEPLTKDKHQIRTAQ